MRSQIGIAAALAASLSSDGFADLGAFRRARGYGDTPGAFGRLRKDPRPKKHRRLATGPGSLVEHDADMRMHLEFPHLHERPRRFVEPTRMAR